MVLAWRGSGRHSRQPRCPILHVTHIKQRCNKPTKDWPHLCVTCDEALANNLGARVFLVFATAVVTCIVGSSTLLAHWLLRLRQPLLHCRMLCHMWHVHAWMLLLLLLQSGLYDVLVRDHRLSCAGIAASCAGCVADQGEALQGRGSAADAVGYELHIMLKQWQAQLQGAQLQLACGAAAAAAPRAFADAHGGIAAAYNAYAAV